MVYRTTFGAALILALGLVTGVQAYNTTGKFGMGLRILGTPVIMSSAMKIGVNEHLSLEPGIGFFEVKQKYEDTYYEYNPSTGNWDLQVSEKWTYIDNALLMTLLGDFKPVRRERSNLVMKAGLAYLLIQESRIIENGQRDVYNNGGIWNLMFVTGLGIEHFFNDHFSVYSGMLAGYILAKDEDYKDEYVSFKGIGSQVLDFSLIWYL